MLILLRGVQLGTTNGKNAVRSAGRVSSILAPANGWAFPVAIWIAGILYLGFGLFLRYHRLGRALYAIGGNADAARVAGIRVERMVWGTLIVSGMLAALAGLMLTGRIASVVTSQGQNMIFYVFAAAVIGGISPQWWQGTAAWCAHRRIAAGHTAERADVGGNPGVLDRCRVRRDYPGGTGAWPRGWGRNGGCVIKSVLGAQLAMEDFGKAHPEI